MKFKNQKNLLMILLCVVSIFMTLTSPQSARAQSWTQKADMPTARHFLHTNVVNGKIYAIGALQPTSLLTKVEEYDPATDTWATKADMPTQRTFIGTCVVDGKIYVMGGEPYWDGPTLATVEAYDPVTDTWTRKADMPTPRASHASSVVNGKIYAIGGDHSTNGTEVSTVEVYDPATDSWTRKTDMPTARSLPSTSVVNGQIYVIGGQTEGGGAAAAFSAVEVYDPVTDTWTRRGDMPWPRTATGCSVVHDMIYCFGGRTAKGGGALSTVLQYDPATDIWTVKDDMPVINAGMGVSAVDGRIYVIGGASFSLSEVLSTVWEYDLAPSPDFNGDGVVDAQDMSILVDHWHTDASRYDLAPTPVGDGFVDVQDLIFLSEHLFEEVDDPTLVAHWALDETEGDIAQDSAGDNFGLVVGGPVWQPTGGQVNGAIQLNGVDDAIIAGLPLNPSVGPFSVLAWIKGGAAGQAVISVPGGVNWLAIDPLDGSLMTELTQSSRGAAPLQSQAVVTDGNWHRLGFVWDGLYRTLYVDGVAVAEDTQDNSMLDAANGLYIGTGKAMAPGTYFSGMIDDVRIYNRAVRP